MTLTSKFSLLLSWNFHGKGEECLAFNKDPIQLRKNMMTVVLNQAKVASSPVSSLSVTPGEYLLQEHFRNKAYTVIFSCGCDVQDWGSG